MTNIAPNYYRLMLGKGSKHAQLCFDENFIGIRFGIYHDLSQEQSKNLQDFNEKFIPIYLIKRPEQNEKIASSACRDLHLFFQDIKKWDILLCPDGSGQYKIGKNIGDYYYHEGEILPHRRSIDWSDPKIDHSILSEQLQEATRSPRTIYKLDKYKDEIDALI